MRKLDKVVVFLSILLKYDKISGTYTIKWLDVNNTR